jgi:hypothetical protein
MRWANGGCCCCCCGGGDGGGGSAAAGGGAGGGSEPAPEPAPEPAATRGGCCWGAGVASAGDPGARLGPFFTCFLGRRKPGEKVKVLRLPSWDSPASAAAALSLPLLPPPLSRPDAAADRGLLAEVAEDGRAVAADGAPAAAAADDDDDAGNAPAATLRGCRLGSERGAKGGGTEEKGGGAETGGGAVWELLPRGGLGAFLGVPPLTFVPSLKLRALRPVKALLKAADRPKSSSSSIRRLLVCAQGTPSPLGGVHPKSPPHATLTSPKQQGTLSTAAQRKRNARWQASRLPPGPSVAWGAPHCRPPRRGAHPGPPGSRLGH